MRWILVPLALAAGADAAMAFAPTSSFTPAARRTANACRAAPRSARLRSTTVKMQWQEIFDETYQAPYYWNEKTGETVWDKPAAMSAPAAPAAASAPPATEEISQEEYEELLRLAGQPAAAQPAAAAKPAGGGGMFGGMFGGGGGAKPAAARSGGGGGLISPGNPVAAKPKAAVVAKPRQQAAAMYDDEDYLTELAPVSKQQGKPQTQKQQAAQMTEELPPVPKEDKPQTRTQQSAAAGAPAQGGGFFGGLFGGNKGKTAAAPQSSVEEVSETELRELMAAAGSDEIQGYSLKEKSGYEGGTRVKVKESVGAPKPSASSMAAAPTNTGVTDLGGVKVTTIRKGMPGEYPQPGDQLTMHYVGKLRATKAVFDSSILRGPPLDFVIGQGQVIQGWDEGILQMTLGEKAQLVIQAEWGYGAGGKGAIPPNSDLVFDVDLLAINGVKPTGRFAGGN